MDTVNKMPTLYERNDIWYMVFWDGDTRRHKSTGCRNYDDALDFARDFMAGVKKQMFGDYAAQFFKWETCPHVARRLEEGKTITRRYVEKQSMYLRRDILTDRIVDIPLVDLKRRDVLDFRARIMRNYSPYVANQILAALKVILSHAEYEQLIDLSPGSKVAAAKTPKKERVHYSIEELTELFKFDHWRNEEAWAFHAFTACTGMRIGETDVLKSHMVDENEIHIMEARKNWDTDEVGLPKWNKQRSILTPFLARLIWNKHNTDIYLFHTNGTPHGYKWIYDTYNEAVESAGLTKSSPHSLRHSLATHLTALATPMFVQLWFGWTPKEMSYTHRQYVHFGGEVLGEVKRAADHVFSDVLSETRARYLGISASQSTSRVKRFFGFLRGNNGRATGR